MNPKAESDAEMTARLFRPIHSAMRKAHGLEDVSSEKAKDEGDLSPNSKEPADDKIEDSKSDRFYLTPQQKAGILLRMIDAAEYCESVAQSWKRTLEKKKRPMADLGLLKEELLRWQSAGYPDPQSWPLSSFCRSELGLNGKESTSSSSAEA